MTTQEMMNDFYLKLKQSYIKPDILLDLTVLELGKIFQLQRAYITYESVKGQLKHHHLYDINKDSINFSEECQNLMDKNPDFKIILKNHKGSLDYGSLIYEILTEPDLQKKEVLRNLRDEMEKSKLSGVFALDDQKYVRNGFLFVGTKLAEVELDANEFSIMKNFILPLQIGISNTELNAEAFRKQREVDQLEKMATLGKMGRGLAHEIKNPLMSIKTFFELGPDLNQNDRESFSNLAKTQLKRIDGLIEKLKGYTQPEKIIKEKIEFKKMVEKMENFLKPELVKNKIIFENKVDSRFNIYVDQNRFEQVLINLIQNAVQAKDDAKATSFIEVSADTEKSVIFIRDNGKGMNAEQIQNIFTPFYTTKKDGNGLGLSIVQNIIESHGGIINVESALDRGTLFQIKL
jgi:signal transduction histidine kinase